MTNLTKESVGAGTQISGQVPILGMQGIKTEAKDVDLRTYAKYLLREGSAVEKRRLLACVKSRFIFKHKTVTLQKID
jgi:hypothetical protein